MIAAVVGVVVFVVLFVFVVFVDMAQTVGKASAQAHEVKFGEKAPENPPLIRQYGLSGRGRIGPGKLGSIIHLLTGDPHFFFSKSILPLIYHNPPKNK